MTRDDLLHAAQSENVQAFLRLIREGESSQDDSAYTVMFGGSHFESFADHPRKKNTAAGLTSTAAGAYQFLERTWDEVAKLYGLADFSPVNQDLGAIALIARRGALDDVIAGRVYEAIRKCGDEWASLPGSKYGQPTQKPDRAIATYLRYGGTMDSIVTTRPVPQEKPMAPIVLPLLQAAASLIPQLGSLFADSEVAKRNVAAGQIVADTLVKATEATNLQDAVEKIQSNPDALRDAKEAVAMIWPSITEGGGGGIDGARKFASEHGNDRYGRILEVVSYCGMTFLLFANCMAFAIGWFKNDWSRMEAVIQADIGVALMVFGFFLGSSISSRSKDAVLADSVRGR